MVPINTCQLLLFVILRPSFFPALSLSLWLPFLCLPLPPLTLASLTSALFLALTSTNTPQQQPIPLQPNPLWYLIPRQHSNVAGKTR